MTILAGDLHDLVEDIFEIDSYKSKMGDDANIITVAFSVKNRDAANDLNEFIEKGYGFVLDSDVTSGEQADGTYKVFVEIERNRHAHDNIVEMIDGIGKLSALDKFKFRYYKNFRSEEMTLENIAKFVPTDPDAYGISTNEANMNNYKNFFSNSYLEESYMYGNTIVLKKAYADPIRFEFIEFGDKDQVVLNETFDVNAYPEILFLTKYLGDYNISKYGEKLVFENKGNALVVKRI